MSDHTAQRKLELSLKAYVEAACGCLVRLSDDYGIIWSGRDVFALARDTEGDRGLYGNARAALRIEVQTRLRLYASREAAKAAHHELFGRIADAIMMDDLHTSLTAAVTGLTVLGVETGESVSTTNENDVLTSAITRTVRAIPQ